MSRDELPQIEHSPLCSEPFAYQRRHDLHCAVSVPKCFIASERSPRKPGCCASKNCTNLRACRGPMPGNSLNRSVSRSIGFIVCFVKFNFQVTENFLLEISYVSRQSRSTDCPSSQFYFAKYTRIQRHSEKRHQSRFFRGSGSWCASHRSRAPPCPQGRYDASQSIFQQC